MNRRSLLRKFGLGALAVAVSPSLVLNATTPVAAAPLGLADLMQRAVDATKALSDAAGERYIVLKEGDVPDWMEKVEPAPAAPEFSRVIRERCTGRDCYIAMAHSMTGLRLVYGHFNTSGSLQGEAYIVDAATGGDSQRLDQWRSSRHFKRLFDADQEQVFEEPLGPGFYGATPERVRMIDGQLGGVVAGEMQAGPVAQSRLYTSPEMRRKMDALIEEATGSVVLPQVMGVDMASGSDKSVWLEIAANRIKRDQLKSGTWLNLDA